MFLQHMSESPVQNLQHLLQCIISDASHGFVPAAPQLVSIDCEEEYQVENITAHWSWCSVSTDSSEPAMEICLNCGNLVQDYEHQEM